MQGPVQGSGSCEPSKQDGTTPRGVSRAFSLSAAFFVATCGCVQKLGIQFVILVIQLIKHYVSCVVRGIWYTHIHTHTYFYIPSVLTAQTKSKYTTTVIVSDTVHGLPRDQLLYDKIVSDVHIRSGLVRCYCLLK